MAAAVYLAFVNYSAITGVDSMLVNHLPYLLAGVAILGALQAWWLRVCSPDIYSRIGATRVEYSVAAAAAPAG